MRARGANFGRQQAASSVALPLAVDRPAALGALQIAPTHMAAPPRAAPAPCAASRAPLGPGAASPAGVRPASPPLPAQRPMGWLSRAADALLGRRQAAAPAAAAPAETAVAAAGDLQAALRGLELPPPKPGAEHLIVMVHGLFGTRDNWTVSCFSAWASAASAARCMWRLLASRSGGARPRVAAAMRCPAAPPHPPQAIKGLLEEHLDRGATLLFVSHANERQRVRGTPPCRRLQWPWPECWWLQCRWLEVCVHHACIR